MKYSILVLALFLLVGCGGAGTDSAEANKTVSQFPVQNGWALTSDLTPSSGHLTVQILIDPHGQKFLVVWRGGGLCMIPYKEPEAPKVEK
jgi:hypothetical protein